MTSKGGVDGQYDQRHQIPSYRASYQELDLPLHHSDSMPYL